MGEKLELKPCPFCGCDAYLRETFDNWHRILTYVECYDCSARGTAYIAHSRGEMKHIAIDAWNRRANDD